MSKHKKKPESLFFAVSFIVILFFLMTPMTHSKPSPTLSPDLPLTDANCDMNQDGKVNMNDISIVAHAVGSYPGNSRWNLHADITGISGLPDAIVDLRDVALVCRNFGHSWSPTGVFWIEPSEVTPDGNSEGFRFNITAWVNVTELSFCWQVDLHFDKTCIVPTNAGFTGIAGSQFFSEHKAVGAIELWWSDCVILIGEALLTGSRAPGLGSLFWVEFEIVRPTTAVSISFDRTWTYILEPRYLHLVPTAKYGSAITCSPA